MQAVAEILAKPAPADADGCAVADIAQVSVEAVAEILAKPPTCTLRGLNHAVGQALIVATIEAHGRS